MAINKQLDIIIDKLTRSIENALSGDKFKTDVLIMTAKDLKTIKKGDWIFDWKAEAKNIGKILYKLVTIDNPNIIQGIVSLEDKGDHIYMHLIESNKFNRGTKKIYLGIPGNLVAFACKLSFDKGYQGIISFESKTRLTDHYHKTLGANILFGNIMTIDSKAASKLINQYFV